MTRRPGTLSVDETGPTFEATRWGSSGTEAGKPVVAFHRAPRVLRAWGTYDALAYNVMSMNPAIMLVIPLLAAFAFYAGGSFPVACLIGGLFCGAQATVYAFLASSMPHSGGDYYFQSRLFSSTLGSVVGLACIVFGGAFWMAIACWLAGNVVVGPAFVIVGQLVGSSRLEAIGVWVQSGTGMLLLSLIVIAWALLMNVRSPKSYVRLQRLLWTVGSAALLILSAMILVAPAKGIIDSQTSIAVLRSAGEHGHRLVAGPHGVGQVLALLPVAAFPLIYPAWSVHHVGEMRDAGRLRSQLLTMLGAEIIIVLASAGVVWLMTARIGDAVLAAGSYLFLTDPAALPLPTLPIFWFFDGELWPAGIAALCLLAFFGAMFWMWVPDIPLAASRVLMVMSRHGSLPSWFGQMSGDDGIPLHAVLAFGLLSLVPTAAYCYTDVWRLSMAETLLNGLAFALTCALAACLPYARRETYRHSTAAPYEILRVPLITVCGCAFVAFIAFSAWRFAVDSGLALGGNPMHVWLLVAGLYGFAFALLVGYRLYRRRHESLEIEVVYQIVSPKSRTAPPTG